MNKQESFCLLQGTVLSGTYQLIKPVGKGGMAHVYKAVDVNLDRTVAIKVISPDWTEDLDESQCDEALKRFETEAQIIARIDHPNIVKIFGFSREKIKINENEQYLDYIAMEYISSRTLRNTMDTDGFESEEDIKKWLTRYMIPILKGLKEVHDSGIIHRDIKPENFLMKGNVPKLCDFGLSLDFSLPSVTSSIVDILGTMNYMAPEQFYNFSMAKKSSDIYSIGKILYEVVEGKLTKKMKPFTQVSLPETDTFFLKQLNGIIKKATSLEPNDRFSGIEELKQQIEQIVILSPKSPGNEKPPFLKLPEVSLFLKKHKLTTATVFFVIAGLFMILSSVPNYYTEDIKRIIDDRKVSHSQGYPEISDILMSEPVSSVKKVISTRDKSQFRLIPQGTVTFHDIENDFKKKQISVTPFYMSENPITTMQYINFLNEIKDRVSIHESGIFMNDKLLIKTNEKIRGYKPIIINGKSFEISSASHAACPVLHVTGYGAKIYAEHYGLRLPTPDEWFFALISGDRGKDEINFDKLPLPTSVMNYKKNHLLIRGLNQIAEWTHDKNSKFSVMGTPPGETSLSNVLILRNGRKYYSDVSFRLAKDLK